MLNKRKRQVQLKDKVKGKRMTGDSEGGKNQYGRNRYISSAKQRRKNDMSMGRARS